MDIVQDNKKQTIKHCEFNFYTNQRRQIQKVIKEKSLKVEDRNIGFGFIYFNDQSNQKLKRIFKMQFKQMKKRLEDRMAKQKDMLDIDEFEELNNQQTDSQGHNLKHMYMTIQNHQGQPLGYDVLNDKDQKKFYMLNGIRHWKYTQAPAPGDLNWRLFCTKSSVLNSLFAYLLKIILLLLVVFCLSPLSFIGYNEYLIQRVTKFLHLREDSTIVQTVTAKAGPYTLILFNFVFIPFCINKTSEFSDFERKSDRHMSNMKWYYFFLFINTIITPITGMSSIKQVISESFGKTTSVTQIITNQLSLCSNFFINYTASQCFFS